MIILPARRKLLVAEEPILLPYHVRGMFRCRVRRPDDRVRVDTGWFPNLIVNQGLDMMLAAGGQDYTAYCAVGTGNSTPANTDTQLNSLVASVYDNHPYAPPAVGNGGTSPNFYGYITNEYQFGQGAAAGNLQEIGVGPSGTSLFSRALILNNVGSPTTLTVLSDEYLSVSYTVQLYNPITDVTGSVNVSGTVCNYTLRAANCNGPAWQMGSAGSWPEGFGLNGVTLYNDTVLQPITGALVGTAQGTADSIALGTYTAGQRYLDGTATFQLSNANGGQNNSAMLTFGATLNRMGAAQIIFGTTIPKTSSQIMTLTFRQSWNRGT